MHPETLRNITEEQVTNLVLLADFLTEYVDEAFFDIGEYRTDNYFKNVNDCGAIGCAIGWSPFIIPVNQNEFVNGMNMLYFSQYSMRIFGYGENCDVGSYMFNNGWESSAEKTKKATVQRIYDVIASDGELTDKMVNKMYTNNIGY